MKEAEYGPRTRLMRIMRALIERPYGYTKNELADLYGVHRDTITGDFQAFENAGFMLRSDEKHRYGSNSSPVRYCSQALW